jgi:hypothetical protein
VEVLHSLRFVIEKRMDFHVFMIDLFTAILFRRKNLINFMNFYSFILSYYVLLYLMRLFCFNRNYWIFLDFDYVLKIISKKIEAIK